MHVHPGDEYQSQPTRAGAGKHPGWLQNHLTLEWMLMVPKRITDESQMLVSVLSRVKGVSVRVLTYCGYSSCEGANDLWNAASRSMQHALGAGLEQQHAGQMEDQGWIFCLLQLLSESLTVHEQGLSKWHTFTKPHKLNSNALFSGYILVYTSFFFRKKGQER